MPYSSSADLPPSFSKEPKSVKSVALRVINRLLKDGMPEDKVFPIALTTARKYVAKHGSAAKSQEAKVEDFIPDDGELHSAWRKLTSIEIESGIDEAIDELVNLLPIPEEFGVDMEEKTWEDGLSETDFSTDQRKKLAKTGAAMPGGGYPIRNVSDLHNAIQAFGRAKDPAATKRHIIARARALGATGSLPDSWKAKEEIDSGTLDPDPEAAGRKKIRSTVNKNKVNKESTGKIMLIHEQAELREAVNEAGTVWDVRCIQAGLSKNRTFYSMDTLKEAVDLFSGVPCFADHSSEYNRSVKDVVGWFESPRLEEDGVYAQFHALESTGWFLGPLKEAYDRGKSDLIGFSINGEGARRTDRVNGQLAYIVDNIRAIESVDGVINPSAGGQVVKLVADRSGGEEEELMALENMSLEELRTARPDLFDQIVASAKEAAAKDADENEPDADDKAAAKKKAAAKTKEAEEEAERVASLKEQALKEQAIKEQELAKLSEQERAEKVREDKISAAETRLQEAADRLDKTQKAMEVSQSQIRVKEFVGQSALPKVIQDKLARRFDSQVATDEQIKEAIEDENSTLKALQDERPLSFPRLEIGEDQKDRAVKALDGLLSGKDVDGVPQARTLREAYAIWHSLPGGSNVDAAQVLREAWTRDYTGYDDMSKSRLREGVSDGSGLTGFTQWGNVLSDRIYKRLLDLYAMPYLEDWRKVCSAVVGVPDFKTQRRIRVGGYGNYASVAEAANYVTITTPTDEQATYKVTKYGNLEKLTLEAIANDDVGALRRIPEQLARGGKHTLFETVMSLISKNPNVSYEAVGLINSASHLNSVTGTGTVDPTLSDASFSKAKRLLMQQTELNSAKKLGLRGKLLLIPPELEATALRLSQNEFAMSLLGNAETGTVTGRERDVNVHRGSFDYLVVPYWADSGEWFFMADPASIPTIEVGFYLGREVPELFVQDMPNVGTNFDADVITYKARLIFGTCILDHRAFIGSSEKTRTS